jgi:hypothetical protein
MSFLNRIKRIKKLIFILLVCILVTSSFFYYKLFLDPENTKSVFYHLSPTEIAKLKEGDIILRRGYGMFSDGIVKVQNGNLNATHCAMLVEKDNNWNVIHALSSSVAPVDGSQYQSFRAFLNESMPNSVVVMRFKSTSDTIKSLVNEMKYYANHTKTFDHDFDRHDTSKFYCTELFQHVFRKVLKKDIFEGQLDSNNTGIYDLTTFQDKRFFREIINHQKRIIKH